MTIPLQKIGFTFFFLFISLQLFSQSREPGEEIFSPTNTEKQSKLSLRLGAGIPQGNYGDDNLDNLDAGLANTGILFEADFFQELSESIYFSLMARFQVNELNPEPLADALAFQVPPSVNIEVETRPYKLNNFMTGIGTVSRIDYNSALISRFLIGVTSMAYPTLEARLSDNTTTLVERISSVNTTTFSYLVGIGLQFDLDAKTSLLIMGDYFGANPEFENVPFSEELNGTVTSVGVQNVEQEIRLINLSIGVSFKL